MSVVTKSAAGAAFDNDSLPVDTKPAPPRRFDNDVDTNCRFESRIDNCAMIGFVRGRKRKLKGIHPNRFWHRPGPQASASYDLVKAERVNGKPRHRFVLCARSKSRLGKTRLCGFGRTFQRMMSRGLSKQQRHHIASEMVRKGACRITP
jgi:hypothetical protein